MHMRAVERTPSDEGYALIVPRGSTTLKTAEVPESRFGRATDPGGASEILGEPERLRRGVQKMLQKEQETSAVDHREEVQVR